MALKDVLKINSIKNLAAANDMSVDAFYVRVLTTGKPEWVTLLRNEAFLLGDMAVVAEIDSAMARVAADAAEAAARIAADATESATRIAQDSAETTARIAADYLESSTRSVADNAMSARILALETCLQALLQKLDDDPGVSNSDYEEDLGS